MNLISSCHQGTQLVVSSLASHTLCREEGSGHAAADELSPRNTIIKQGRKMLTSAKHVMELLSMTMDAFYEQRGSHWSQQVSAVATTP